MARFVRLSAFSLVLGFVFMAAVAPEARAMTLVGVFNENDPFPDPLLGSPALAKCDLTESGECVWENGSIPGEDYSDGDFVLTFNESGEVFSGTWSFAPNDGETLVPTFLVVKAGNYFAAYSLEISPGVFETSGTFDTSDIPGNPAISHISFYDTGAPPPIPEPASWIMMIFGFWMVAWRLRSRRSCPGGVARAPA